MTDIFKPMLASPADLTRLRFPLSASPKLDGIRAIVRDGVVMSRSMKPIPNRHVQALFGGPELEGFDGELIVGDPAAKDCYLKTNSGVMSIEGEPDVMFHVFDYIGPPNDAHTGPTGPWGMRNAYTWSTDHPRVIHVEHRELETLDDLLAYEEERLAEGYEGVMLRDQEAPYKQGRSTVKEGYLLKLKRFTDSEAVITGIVELMHNDNEAKTNALGHTERSTAKEGLRPSGMMGTLQVRDLHSGVEFEIGTGFTKEQRIDIFTNQIQYLGKLVKYQYFEVGMKDKPRFPSFRGLRDERDM